MEIQLTEQNFEEEVLNASGLVLVDFYAVWCGPCKMLSPHITALAEAYPAMKVCRLNVDEATAVAERYGVQSIPTLIFFRDGEIVKTLVGYRDPAELKAVTEALL